MDECERHTFGKHSRLLGQALHRGSSTSIFVLGSPWLLYLQSRLHKHGTPQHLASHAPTRCSCASCGIDYQCSAAQVASRHVGTYCNALGYAHPNITFVQGFIECLPEAGIGPESADLVMSNCVVNLSPDKAAVLHGAYRALAPGGEMYFADVYCDRRLPESIRQDEVRWDP